MEVEQNPSKERNWVRTKRNKKDRRNESIYKERTNYTEQGTFLRS